MNHKCELLGIPKDSIVNGDALTVTRGGRIIVDGSAVIVQFTQQLNIVKAAKEALESTLIDLTSILQVDLFDSEVDSARALQKSGFLRAAGAICGVVIEKHLNPHFPSSVDIQCGEKAILL